MKPMKNKIEFRVMCDRDKYKEFRMICLSKNKTASEIIREFMDKQVNAGKIK